MVKICGITNTADAQTASRCGADLRGLVFVPTSKRCMTIAQAREICAQCQQGPPWVGLFADQDGREVRQTLAHLKLNLIQLHGREDAAYVNDLAQSLPEHRFLKAFAFRGRETLSAMLEFYHALKARDRLFAFLLEGPWGGGSGRPFDWQVLADALQDGAYTIIREKLILAGGLNSQNVRQAITMVRPIGVDVSTGVEASPGRKDPRKIEEFIRLAKTQE